LLVLRRKYIPEIQTAGYERDRSYSATELAEGEEIALLIS
jgi:hypothetical protein